MYVCARIYVVFYKMAKENVKHLCGVFASVVAHHGHINADGGFCVQVSGVRFQMTEDPSSSRLQWDCDAACRGQRTKDRIRKWEVGLRKAEKQQTVLSAGGIGYFGSARETVGLDDGFFLFDKIRRQR